jgi:predicted ATPase
MFSNIHIERFRGISKLDLDGLRPINLLVGKNNTGKTSVLEAILLLCGATDPFTPTRIGQMRGQRIGTAGDSDIIWRSLFADMTGKSPIELAGWQDNGGHRRLRIEQLAVTSYSQDNDEQPGVIVTDGNRGIGGVRLSYTPANGSTPIVTQAVFDIRTRQVEAPSARQQQFDFVPGTLLSSRSFFNLSRDTETYSFLVRRREEQQVIDTIRLLDPRVERLAIVSEASGATVYADIGGDSLIPLAVCGEGMLRLFSILLAFIRTGGGVLLIDEIDNGLHYTVMNKLWSILQKLCFENHVQLIATTHNEEMLQGAIAAFQKDLKEFGLFRLDRTQNGIRAVSYDEEALQGLVETAWEVRG